MIFALQLFSPEFLSPLFHSLKVAFKLKSLFSGLRRLYWGWGLALPRAAWWGGGYPVGASKGSLHAAEVPWGLRGGRRVGDTRRALSRRGGKDVPGWGRGRPEEEGGRRTLKGALFACALQAPAGGGASARSGLPSSRAAGSGQTRRRARSWGRTGR